MAQPIWNTDAGSLGTYPTGQRLNFKIIALPDAPATTISFRLISGLLPTGVLNEPVVITPDGYITGMPENQVLEKTYTFTIRVNDELGNFSDRTFSMTMVGSNSPSLVLEKQEILNVVDSIYVNYDIPYKNPANIDVFFTHAAGELPPGLVLTTQGKIAGYPLPPKKGNGSPTKTTYSFVVQLNSSLGTDTQSYSITVRNQRLTQPKNTRKPVILNSRPLVYPIPKDDMMYNFYLVDGNKIPDINAGEYFSFKVMGYDFDSTKIVYNFSGLPPGLNGDVNTGWITGVPQTSDKNLLKYDVAVTVSKEKNRTIISDQQILTLRVASNVKQDIEWITGQELGQVNNGTISNLYVKATSAQDLQYKLESGELPANITLFTNGELSGRFPYQPTTKTLNPGASTVYKFAITAFSPSFPILRSTREFTLTVYQYFDVPVETVYIKASSSVKGRQVTKSLLEDTSLIPTESLYRANDPYFGKSTYVSFAQVYGVPTASAEQYIAAMDENHYTKTVILQPFKTAVARDDNNNIIYEVIYSEIFGGLTNEKGESVPNTVEWDKTISLNAGPWTINNSSIHISFNNYNTSLSPGNIRYLHPNSLVNMRSRIVSALGQNTDVTLLPKWMTSQQLDGNTIGFIPAWVVCYTLPGKSQEILDNINNNWGHSLNEIDFMIDRYVIDKSGTYNWNHYLATPTWSELPSAVPTPSPLEERDMVVLFPRTTILPKAIDY